MTSITPFGQTGPYSHYKGEEIVAYATGGIMSISGTYDREPLKHGGFQAQSVHAAPGLYGGRHVTTARARRAVKEKVRYGATTPRRHTGD
jgi:crotonobetainyl-CoA:carnitine CoA-transferase CaiB-like acyl-CoA transferase